MELHNRHDFIEYRAIPAISQENNSFFKISNLGWNTFILHDAPISPAGKIENNKHGLLEEIFCMWE